MESTTMTGFFVLTSLVALITYPILFSETADRVAEADDCRQNADLSLQTKHDELDALQSVAVSPLGRAGAHEHEQDYLAMSPRNVHVVGTYDLPDKILTPSSPLQGTNRTVHLSIPNGTRSGETLQVMIPVPHFGNTEISTTYGTLVIEESFDDVVLWWDNVYCRWDTTSNPLVSWRPGRIRDLLYVVKPYLTDRNTPYSAHGLAVALTENATYMAIGSGDDAKVWLFRMTPQETSCAVWKLEETLDYSTVSGTDTVVDAWFNFGSNVLLDSAANTLVVEASTASTSSLEREGAFYVFSYHNGTWNTSTPEMVTPSFADGYASDGFRVNGLSNDGLKVLVNVQAKMLRDDQHRNSYIALFRRDNTTTPFVNVAEKYAAVGQWGAHSGCLSADGLIFFWAQQTYSSGYYRVDQFSDTSDNGTYTSESIRAGVPRKFLGAVCSVSPDSRLVVLGNTASTFINVKDSDTSRLSIIDIASQGLIQHIEYGIDDALVFSSNGDLLTKHRDNMDGDWLGGQVIHYGANGNYFYPYRVRTEADVSDASYDVSSSSVVDHSFGTFLTTALSGRVRMLVSRARRGVGYFTRTVYPAGVTPTIYQVSWARRTILPYDYSPYYNYIELSSTDGSKEVVVRDVWRVDDNEFLPEPPFRANLTTSGTLSNSRLLVLPDSSAVILTSTGSANLDCQHQQWTEGLNSTDCGGAVLPGSVLYNAFAHPTESGKMFLCTRSTDSSCSFQTLNVHSGNVTVHASIDVPDGDTLSSSGMTVASDWSAWAVFTTTGHDLIVLLGGSGTAPYKTLMYSNVTDDVSIRGLVITPHANEAVMALSNGHLKAFSLYPNSTFEELWDVDLSAAVQPCHALLLSPDNKLVSCPDRALVIEVKTGAILGGSMVSPRFVFPGIGENATQIPMSPQYSVHPSKHVLLSTVVGSNEFAVLAPTPFVRTAMYEFI